MRWCHLFEDVLKELKYRSATRCDNKLTPCLVLSSEASLVLSWRAREVSSPLSQLGFSRDEDVRMFFVYFENTVLRRKESKKKVLMLLAYLDGVH